MKNIQHFIKSDKETFKQLFKKRIYAFVVKLIIFLDTVKKDDITNIIMRQLIRSATSIIANYVEAQSSSSKKDFTNYFHHALKSANESKVWIARMIDTHRISKNAEVLLFQQKIREISNILAASSLPLKGKQS